MVKKVLGPKFQLRTFTIKCNRKISKRAKILLQNIKLKVYYYVIDDILYFLKSDKDESEYLVQVLNSTAIFLQNNFCVNFFDIYIYDIQVNDISKFNRFTNNPNESFKSSNNIIIKLAYQVKPIEKMFDTTW
jgi:hypothetical protein